MKENSLPQIKRRDFIRQSGLGLAAFTLPFPTSIPQKINTMTSMKKYDAIIVGGSYSGLAAAMALGRALKRVLIIDSGAPCNRQTPHSHNFLTQDGKTPSEIARIGKEQVQMYKIVDFVNGLAMSGRKTDAGFEIDVHNETYKASKLIFATGIKDSMPAIDGFEACWGISVLHCPYCHGYEVKQKKTGIIGNGEAGYETAKLISNWTTDLTLYTNGPSTLTDEQVEKLGKHSINIVESEIDQLDHENGYVKNILFKDGKTAATDVIYSPRPFTQHCMIPESLGCELTEEGYIKVDQFHETTVKAVFASGDNVTRMRTVANAVSMGTAAGISVSKKLIFESF